MLDLILITILTASLLGNLFQLTGNQKLKGILRTALRNADNYKPGGRDHVRVPYNQLAAILGWRPENFPQYSDKDFTGKPQQRHPATVSAVRRRKLRR